MARGALMETLDLFTPADREARKANSWSAKDHIAHLVAWEQMIVATARDRSAQRFAGLEPGADNGLELAEINVALRTEQRNALG